MFYFTSKKHILAAFICAALLTSQHVIAIEDEDVDEDETIDAQETDAVNMITDFLNNLDEDKAEELKKVINETVDKPVKDDAKQYGIMFDKLQKADSKTFSKILNVLAKEDELHEELELIASNCPSIMAKTVIRSAIKEAKEEH